MTHYSSLLHYIAGTPIQNNLNEFYSLIHWVTKGKLFHSLAAFKEDFTQPILQGQNPTASYEQQQASSFAAEKLLETTRHIILQRKKCELTESTMMKLPDKVELVVWVPLSSAQSSMYEDFIHSRQFSTALHRSTCPVEVINHLKTVCRHPFLIEAALANKRRKSALASASSSSLQSFDDLILEFSEMGIHSNEIEDLSDFEGNNERMSYDKLSANSTVFEVANRQPSVDELLRGSIKLRVLISLVTRLRDAEHRILIFSQSKLMLDIIQRVLAEWGRLATHRIDGREESSVNLRPNSCMTTTTLHLLSITYILYHTLSVSLNISLIYLYLSISR